MNHFVTWQIRDGKGHVLSNVAVFLLQMFSINTRSLICFLFASSLDGSGAGGDVLHSSSRANSSMTRKAKPSSSASSLMALPLITETISSASSLLASPLITEAISSLMQSAGFDFFFAGEPDETVEAVEVEAFEVGMAAKKDGILDCRCAFWIAFAMSAFNELERGHNFGSSSLLPKEELILDLLRRNFGVCARARGK